MWYKEGFFRRGRNRVMLSVVYGRFFSSAKVFRVKCQLAGVQVCSCIQFATVSHYVCTLIFQTPTRYALNLHETRVRININAALNSCSSCMTSARNLHYCMPLFEMHLHELCNVRKLITKNNNFAITCTELGLKMQQIYNTCALRCVLNLSSIFQSPITFFDF